MSDVELSLRIIELSISFLALILVIFGWVIPYRQSKQSEKERNNYEKEMEKIRLKRDFIDKQIAKLYGPLAAIIRELDISFELITFQLGRKYIFKDNQQLKDLPENEQKIWVHYVNTYKIPAQAKMVEIIRNNTVLMYNSEMPECVYRFLEYCIGWELLDNQSKNGVPNFYSYHYSFNYPKEFDRYVCETLNFLLDEQKRLRNLELDI